MQNAAYPRGAVSITPPYTPTRPMCGFVASGTGTVTITDELGNSTAIPVVAGIPIFVSFASISASTATGLVGFLAT